MASIIIALAGKDIRLLLRDRGGALVTFVLPFIYCVFFGFIFASRSGGGGAMPIVVVDEDQSERSGAFVDTLDGASEFSVTRATRTEAMDEVRRGKKVAYLVLTKGFGEAMGQVLMNERPRIEVGVDPARTAEAAMVSGLLTKYAFESIISDFTDSESVQRQVGAVRKKLRENTALPPAQRETLDRFFGELDRFVVKINTPAEGEDTASTPALADADGLSGWQPFDIAVAEVGREREGPKNSFEISFPQGIIWGVLGCCASFGASMVIERTSGTLSRLRVAPIGRTAILAGKALACFGSTITLAVALFVVAWLLFDVVPHSVGHLAVSLVMIAIAFVGIMMFLSILGKTERSVSGLGWGVLLGMAMLGGGMVPRMFMPQWMQSLSHISPVKWAILAMEGAVWRDFSTTEMLLPWGVLLGVGIVFFAVGVKGFSWQTEG